MVRFAMVQYGTAWQCLVRYGFGTGRKAGQVRYGWIRLG